MIVTLIGVMYVRNILVQVFGIGETARSDLSAVTSKRAFVLAFLELISKSANAVISGIDSSTPQNIGKNLVSTTIQTLDGFKRGAIEMAPLVGILASLGIILQLVQATGLTGEISQQMVSLAGGVLILLLVIAMLASILFGLGMPTPAAYILVAMLIVPSVISAGVPEITAHMFVFYFAMLSAITPPVAVAVAIGSNIANANFLKSSIQALRIGAPGFVIPFAFVTNNSLIYWSFPDTLISFPAVLAGTSGLIVMTIGFDGSRSISTLVRLGYGLLASFAMFGSVLHVSIQIVAAFIIVVSLAYKILYVGYEPEVGDISSTSPMD
ncbi:TRAP transporter large permease subunit [Natrialbaceae archaeon A-gly3]